MHTVLENLGATGECDGAQVRQPESSVREESSIKGESGLVGISIAAESSAPHRKRRHGMMHDGRWNDPSKPIIHPDPSTMATIPSPHHHQAWHMAAPAEY